MNDILLRIPLLVIGYLPSDGLLHLNLMGRVQFVDGWLLLGE
jgi:hypothetical protein